MPTAADRTQHFRLARFRRRHPGVVIAEGDFSAWEARIPEPDGERVMVRDQHRGGLRGLLDDLERFFGRAPDTS